MSVPHRAPLAADAPSVRPRSHARLFGMVLGAVLLASACGPKEEIVYVDRISDAESGAAAYTPIGRSTDPRVHVDGEYQPAPSAQVGPAHLSGSPEPYAPISTSHGPLVHAGGEPHLSATVTLAHERGSVSTSGHAASTPTPAGSAPVGPIHAPSGGTASSSVPRPAGALDAASPTVPARLSLGAGLGATPGEPSPVGSLASLTQEDLELVTASGRVERVDGAVLTLQTPTGPRQVTLDRGVRVERDALGSADDLKPGQFVGVLQIPNGPASSVRLYTTGPSMPKAGVVPMLGARLGQVTTYGSVVALQFGGLLLKTDIETTSVTLPSTVEILRPVPVGAGDLAAGQQVIVTGVQTGDDTLAATAVRITAESRAHR